MSWSKEDRRWASHAIEMLLVIAFTVALYYAGIEAYNIRLYAIKTFGAPATFLGSLTLTTMCRRASALKRAASVESRVAGRVIHEFDPWYASAEGGHTPASSCCVC